MPDRAHLNYIDNRLKSTRRSMTVGFLLLVAGVAYGVHESNLSTKKNTEVICGLVFRLDEANLQSYDSGKITLAQRKEAQAVYALLRDPSYIDCSTGPIK